MGERPVGTTLDRIDSNSNYEPGNCRWATAKEQGRSSKERWARISEEERSRHMQPVRALHPGRGPDLRPRKEKGRQPSWRKANGAIKHAATQPGSRRQDAPAGAGDPRA